MNCISKENLKNKKPKRKCVVCGNNFEIVIDKKYIIKMREGLVDVAYFDAMDCPKCGCQNIIWKRAEKVNKNTEKTKK